MKIKIENMECYQQVADVIGKGRASCELFKVAQSAYVDESVPLGMAFDWDEPLQGFAFWCDISKGRLPQ